jgi:hypothetical protein
MLQRQTFVVEKGLWSANGEKLPVSGRSISGQYQILVRTKYSFLNLYSGNELIPGQ